MDITSKFKWILKNWDTISPYHRDRFMRFIEEFYGTVNISAQIIDDNQLNFLDNPDDWN